VTTHPDRVTGEGLVKHFFSPSFLVSEHLTQEKRRHLGADPSLLRSTVTRRKERLSTFSHECI